MNSKFWNIEADGEECVHITISEEVNIDDVELTLINDVRMPILTIKIDKRDIHICSVTDKPMFARIGECVRYVNGSGHKSYKDFIKE